MKNSFRIVSELLLALAILGGCSGAGPADTGGSGGTGGATAGSGGNVSAGSGGARDRSQCGSVDCRSWNTCCLGESGEVCGLMLPTDVFATSCVLKEAREGALDSTCAESRDYCPELDGVPCIFPGCRRTSGSCGFWVEDYWVFNKWEAFMVHYADNLGCLAVEEFVP